MIEVQILVPECDKNIIRILKSTVSKVFEVTGRQKEYALTISIGSEKFVRQLNKTYRQIDLPTDVLSFSEEYIIPDSEILYLGDIAISFPTAKAQADEAEHPVVDELILLTIHGVLHLLGYDHQEKDKKTEMWSLQYQILEILGVKMDRFSGDE